MSGGHRSLPRSPNLRYLKLEARRRVAAGEFTALHLAQQVIASEYGLPSWAALKRLIGPGTRQSHALAQLRWIAGRFGTADGPGWTAPGEPELRQHFDDGFLAALPPGELVVQIASQAAALRAGLVVVGAAPLTARVRVAGLEYYASVDAAPPHRLTGLVGYPAPVDVTDPRLAALPPTRTSGDAPVAMIGLAESAAAELGLAGLVLAGGRPGDQAWAVARGLADLDRAEPLTPGHRFPALGITALVTATAVLRLVADGRVGLDAPAGRYLRGVRLADDSVTVRELLTHTSGIGSPDPALMFAERVPELITVLGDVVPVTGTRGTVRPANGGYAVLGQVVADVVGLPFAAAAAELVLGPLGMSGSRFPETTAQLGAGSVTCYTATPDGALRPAPPALCTIPAAGGLWAPAADLVRLGTGWPALLSAPLAREALMPQTPPGPGGLRAGFGWLLLPGGGVAMHAGVAPDARADLLVRIADGQVHLALANRLITQEALIRPVLAAWSGEPDRGTQR